MGKRLKLVFEIGPGYCKLIERDEPELQHLVGQKLVPGVLLHVNSFDLARSCLDVVSIYSQLTKIPNEWDALPKKMQRKSEPSLILPHPFVPSPFVHLNGTKILMENECSLNSEKISNSIDNSMKTKK